jgi:ABC-type branched-subunit amino acid transport system substrate-binding protein
MGAFDSGGASTVSQCGIPDLRAITTTPERVASPMSFGTDSINPPQVSTAQYRYLKSITGNAYQHYGVIYLAAGAATPNALADAKTAQYVGFTKVYEQGVDVTNFNYAPFVSAMKSAGVTFLQYVGAWQYALKIKQAMNQQGFHPVFMMDSVAYDPAFITSGGADINGTYAFVDTNLFEEASRSPELQTYLTWLQRVAPGATPSFFGIFAWGAMRLFSQLAVLLGGQLSRASLLAAIRSVGNYTSNNLFTAQNVGAKKTPNCQAVIQLQGTRWVRMSPYPYTCADVYNTA